jgi:hypothetical protein
VARLEEVRLLDDHAFARTLARSKWRTSKWGAPRLRMALAARQLPPEAITAALEELFDEADGEGAGAEAEQALLRACRARWYLSRTLPFEARPVLRCFLRCVCRAFGGCLLTRACVCV